MSLHGYNRSSLVHHDRTETFNPAFNPAVNARMKRKPKHKVAANIKRYKRVGKKWVPNV